MLAAPAARAQSPAEDQPKDSARSLPVSLDKIREGLETTPVLSLRTLNEQPTFTVMIRERQKIEELLASINFKSSSPPPAGGLYAYEQQRVMFPSVDHPLVQPYAAFNQPELLTILVENLAGKYLAGKAMQSITTADRARAEAAAREEVRRAVSDYCAAQPNAGAGIAICDAPLR
jgi:hypothetical protein